MTHFSFIDISQKIPTGSYEKFLLDSTFSLVFSCIYDASSDLFCFTGFIGKNTCLSQKAL